MEQLNEEHELHAERLLNKLEEAEKKHKEQQHTEQEVLHEAKELAESHEDRQKTREPVPAERRRGPISKKQLDNSFHSQMNHVRDHMTPGEKLYSRFMHTKAVEKASDFIGSTIARPNAMLTGSIFAFISVTILYFTANHFGIQLSGFETIGTFILGWFVGIIYDYASVAFRKRNRP